MKGKRFTDAYEDGLRLPPRYPGTWNAWPTTSRQKIEEPFANRPSQRQLLTNEIGDYADQIDKRMKDQILKAIHGLTWYDIPLIVHRIVCPQCRTKEAGDQLTLFGD